MLKLRKIKGEGMCACNVCGFQWCWCWETYKNIETGKNICSSCLRKTKEDYEIIEEEE